MNQPLSVCLVCTFYPPDSFGGDAVHVQRLAAGLAQRGHRVRVLHSPVAYRLLGGTSSAKVTEARDDGVEVIPVPEGTGAGGSTVATYMTGRPLGYRRRLHELASGFDVIHFHNPSLLGGPGAFGIGDGEAVRLYTAHEHWLVCPTHTLFRYGKEVCTRRTCWRCTMSYRRPPQAWRSTGLMRRQLDHLDAVITPSRFTGELHRRSLPGVRVEVIPSPGPERRLVESALANAGAAPHRARPYFLFAGRLESIKGIDRLVPAFSRVRGADLVVVGDGSLGDELHRVAADNPAVSFTGRRPYADVLSLARSALAVVVPSAGYETFGGVALEAMALGTPVVVRALGPLPELVEHGGGVAVADDDALVAALQGLVDQPERATGLGREGQDIAARHYGEPQFFRRYFDLVADVARRRHLSGLSKRSLDAAGAEGEQVVPVGQPVSVASRRPVSGSEGDPLGGDAVEPREE